MRSREIHQNRGNRKLGIVRQIKNFFKKSREPAALRRIAYPPFSLRASTNRVTLPLKRGSCFMVYISPVEHSSSTAFDQRRRG